MIFVNLNQLRFEDNVDSILEEDFDKYEICFQICTISNENFIILLFCHFVIFPVNKSIMFVSAFAFQYHEI